MEEVSRAVSAIWRQPACQANNAEAQIEIVTERAQLLTQIETARQRTVAAEGAVPALAAALLGEIGLLVLAARRELLEVEQQQAYAVALLLANAEAEASSVIAAAHAGAATLREVARSIDRAASDNRFGKRAADVDAG